MFSLVVVVLSLIHYLVHLLQCWPHRQDDGLDDGLRFNKRLKSIDCNILTDRLMNTAGCVYGCVYVCLCLCV